MLKNIYNKFLDSVLSQLVTFAAGVCVTYIIALLKTSNTSALLIAFIVGMGIIFYLNDRKLKKQTADMQVNFNKLLNPKKTLPFIFKYNVYWDDDLNPRCTNCLNPLIVNQHAFNDTLDCYRCCSTYTLSTDNNESLLLSDAKIHVANLKN